MSFIQILKAATPVMTMVILVIAKLDKLSTPVRRQAAPPAGPRQIRASPLPHGPPALPGNAADVAPGGPPRPAQVTIAVSIIAVGTAIASWGELAFSMVGFIIMVTSGARARRSAQRPRAAPGRVSPARAARAAGARSARQRAESLVARRVALRRSASLPQSFARRASSLRCNTSWAT